MNLDMPPLSKLPDTVAGLLTKIQCTTLVEYLPNKQAADELIALKIAYVFKGEFSNIEYVGIHNRAHGIQFALDRSLTS